MISSILIRLARLPVEVLARRFFNEVRLRELEQQRDAALQRAQRAEKAAAVQVAAQRGDAVLRDALEQETQRRLLAEQRAKDAEEKLGVSMRRLADLEREKDCMLAAAPGMRKVLVELGIRTVTPLWEASTWERALAALRERTG